MEFYASRRDLITKESVIDKELACFSLFLHQLNKISVLHGLFFNNREGYAAPKIAKQQHQLALTIQWKRIFNLKTLGPADQRSE